MEYFYFYFFCLVERDFLFSLGGVLSSDNGRRGRGDGTAGRMLVVLGEVAD